MNKLDKKILNFMKKYNIPISRFKKIKYAVLLDYSEETRNENTIYSRMSYNDLADICNSI